MDAFASRSIYTHFQMVQGKYCLSLGLGESHHRTPRPSNPSLLQSDFRCVCPDPNHSPSMAGRIRTLPPCGGGRLAAAEPWLTAKWFVQYGVHSLLIRFLDIARAAGQRPALRSAPLRDAARPCGLGRFLSTNLISSVHSSRPAVPALAFLAS